MTKNEREQKIENIRAQEILLRTQLCEIADRLDDAVARKKIHDISHSLGNLSWGLIMLFECGELPPVEKNRQVLEAVKDGDGEALGNLIFAGASK